MNIFKEYEGVVVAILEALARDGKIPAGLDTSKLTVEPPRDPSHGDLSTNAAMVLGKQARMAPKALAEMIVAALAERPEVTQVDIAGPGFINLRLEPSIWLARITDVLRSGNAYGDGTVGAGRKVNVEYVSANPTGPLHAAHGRGAVFGDALASLLAKAGFDVTREYYINDAGAQVQVLGRSAYLRYREVLGEDIGEIPAGLYPGEYLKEVAQALVARDGEKWMNAEEADWLPAVRDFAIDQIMGWIREDLGLLGVDIDVYTSERSLVESGAADRALKVLEDAGLIYVGVLEPPKGKKPDDWEPRPQTLFRATRFGDDVDRPLKKSDGTNTYFANDIAYHHDKFTRGYTDQIDVWGADHGGYIKRMRAATTAVTGGAAELDVKICQLVHLMRNGEPVKMSKRAGTFVTLRDVIEQVGRDVVRFIMLTRRNDQTLEFDFAKVMEQSKENPVFYVHYAHARCCSVLRNALGDPGDRPILTDAVRARLAEADLSPLESEEELALARRMAQWPRMVEAAAEAHEPHRVAFYLADLAADFHGLWNRGKDDTTLRFILEDDPALTNARLALVAAVATVLASGLLVMGVTPLEELRA